MSSGSTGNTASGAFEKPGRSSTVVNLETARRMLPLVRHIIGDIVQSRHTLERLQPEQERLDRHKCKLDWPQRQRRYQVREEMAATEQNVNQSLAELQGLSVILVDPELGQVGFPTIVNKRPAFFSWHPGEEELLFWHFADDPVRRPIPKMWLKGGTSA